MKLKKIFVFGYTLDTCLYARKLADLYNVEFLKTGKLGYPFDEIDEHLYKESIDLIIKILGKKIDFLELVNSIYIYVPYNEIKFFNTKNGLISYPFNRLSFEIDSEYAEIVKCYNNLVKFYKESNNNNFINTYKSFFPKWFYESVVKYIGINKWGGIKQSRLTKQYLFKEIDLSNINNYGSGIVYKPNMTYENLCKELLNHTNITVSDYNIDDLNDFIKGRYKNVEIIIMDNRIDKVVGYHNGALDRVDISVLEEKNENNIEFIDVDEGIVFTPKNKYWCVSNFNNSVKKLYSKMTNDCSKETILMPTLHNKKLIKEYKELVNLYSGKKLNLKTYVKTVIL